MCFIDVDDPCQVWRESWHKARKQHRCDCCERTITSGERYMHHVSIYDFDVTDEKCCAQCADGRQAFQDDHGGIIGGPGYFIDLLRDCIAEGDDDSERKWKPMLESIMARRPQAAP